MTAATILAVDEATLRARLTELEISYALPAPCRPASCVLDRGAIFGENDFARRMAQSWPPLVVMTFDRSDDVLRWAAQLDLVVDVAVDVLDSGAVSRRTSARGMWLGWRVAISAVSTIDPRPFPPAPMGLLRRAHLGVI